MEFHKILRQLIDEHGLTQKQVALDLKIPVSTLGGYVQGTSEPDFETLKLIAAYFDTSTDYLLNIHQPQLNSFKENTLLNIFRTLSDEQQDLYIEQGKAFIKINSNHLKKTKIKFWFSSFYFYLSFCTKTGL